MDQQAKLAVKINAAVMLILETHKKSKYQHRRADIYHRRESGDAYLLQSRDDFEENLSNRFDAGIHAQDSVRNHFGQ